MVKVKLSLCLTNYALYHDGVWGSGCIHTQIKSKTGENTRGSVQENEGIAEINAVGPSRGQNLKTTDPKVGSSTTESSRIPGNLGNNEFALPNFDENKGMYPVAHIRQLEEFFQFRGIPQHLWLIVAKKSIVGSVSRQ
jgi:hypothetical protein